MLAKVEPIVTFVWHLSFTPWQEFKKQEKRGILVRKGLQNNTKLLNGKNRSIKEEATNRLIEDEVNEMEFTEKLGILLKLLNNISRNFF